MITAARELDTVSAALDGGAADYLVKPFEFGQLRTKLEAFAARADTLASAAGAGPDHPVHPALPETAYLKFLAYALD